MRLERNVFKFVILCISIFLVSCVEVGEDKVENKIGTSVGTLLSSTQPGNMGGFVSFIGDNELEYVQYSLDKMGMLLYWPVGGDKTISDMRKCVSALDGLGFEQVFINDLPTRVIIENLKVNEYVVFDDGLYSQVGRDKDTVTHLTKLLLHKVFNYNDLENIKVTLEIDG